MVALTIIRAKSITFNTGTAILEMPVTGQFVIEGSLFLCAGSVWYSFDALIHNPKYDIILN